MTSPTTRAHFLKAGAGIEPQLPHRVEQPAMHRLQPVARIGQRALHDGRERISEVALLERLAERDLLDVAGIRRNRLFSHDLSLLPRGRGNKPPMGQAGQCAGQFARIPERTIVPTSAMTPMTGETTL